MADIIRRPFSWLKLFQLLGGLICFGLYFKYHGQVDASVIYGANSSDEAFVRQSFTTTVLVGYPFIIVLLTTITLCVAGESLEKHLLCFMLNFVGFGMYLTVGALIAHFTSDYNNSSDELKATAAMCIITSFFFLCDVIIYLLQRFRS